MKQVPKMNLFGSEKDSLAQVKPIVDLNSYRRSPSPGASASRPKYTLDVDGFIVYFKFKLTSNEICGEIFSYEIAKVLGIPVAKTVIVKYKNEIGIGSYDIGDHSLVEETNGYIISNYVDIGGFVTMCLFDYLIMNEDRHSRNWGYRISSEGKLIAPLFDHNQTFGGDSRVVDSDYFMHHLTSALNLDTEDHYKHDEILTYLVLNYSVEVKRFVHLLPGLKNIKIDYLHSVFPDQYTIVHKLLCERIDYMIVKVHESVQKIHKGG